MEMDAIETETYFHGICFMSIERISPKMVNMKVLSDSYGGYFNLLAKIRTLSEQWRSKTSKEKFAMLYSIPQWMFEVVGVRVYGDCQLNLFSNFGHVMVAYYVSMVVYTIYYWSCKGQFVYGLKSLCGMGIMISVSYCKCNDISVRSS